MTLYHPPGTGMCQRHPLHSEPCAMCAAEASVGGELPTLKKRDRVALVEDRGSLRIINLGQVVRVTRSGYVHVEWDDKDEGFFSPAKAAASLRLAEGDDALPRHVWIYDVPLRRSMSWDGPLPTLDSPVCAVCREAQSDENEFGPCRKAKP
jgi:hypothetical protein